MKISKEVADYITDKLQTMYEKPYWNKGSYDDAIDDVIDMILDMVEENSPLDVPPLNIRFPLNTSSEMKWV